MGEPEDEDSRARCLTFDGVLKQRVQQGSGGAVVQPQPAKQEPRTHVTCVHLASVTKPALLLKRKVWEGPQPPSRLLELSNCHPITSRAEPRGSPQPCPRPSTPAHVQHRPKTARGPRPSGATPGARTRAETSPERPRLSNSQSSAPPPGTSLSPGDIRSSLEILSPWGRCHGI